MAKLSDSDERFQSVDHPGTVSATVAFGSFLVRPIGATMLPVMVIGVVLVLQQQDALPFLAWAGPLALGAAAAWTWYRFRTIIVEVVVTDNGAVALTVMEAVGGGTSPGLQRVFDVRERATRVQVTIGRATYELESDDWPELGRMVDALKKARAFYD